VIGLGMNQKELDANPVLSQRLQQNLNIKPQIPEELGGSLDATLCVVSIDYLTKPVEVLESIRRATRVGGKVHLIVSNRCFPTKAVGRWLRVGEQERLDMVGEYLWWSGWRELEIEELSDGTVKNEEEAGGVMALAQRLGLNRRMVDPLWVVRGVKTTSSEAEARVQPEK
jgi:SAM-dependent methyltransferase